MRLILEIYNKFLEKLEKYLILLSVSFFIGGIILSKFFATFANAISDGSGKFVDGYGQIAPVAIFLILSPSLSKLLSSKVGKFGIHAFGWLGIKRLLACLWGAVFTVIIFGFPILPSGNDVNAMAAIVTALKTIAKVMVTSPYMIAIWIGIVVALVSLKVRWIYKFMEVFLSGFESVGRHLLPFIPLFMMAVGAYVYGLPSNVNQQIELGDSLFTLQSVKFLGFGISPNTPGGMVAIYVVGALFVGLACLIWHFYLLLITRHKVKGFYIKDYIKNYWSKIYPLLWATSSEGLSAPLNLYLTKKYYPQVAQTVRRFVVGMGSLLNINGTVICVFVLGGVVTSMLGLQPSLLAWLLAIPGIFLLAYGVPGLPGELILFAGPVALLLNLPADITPIFLALYIGLQVGLPDSFRTGNNSTDNVLYAILLNETYQKKYTKRVKYY